MCSRAPWWIGAFIDQYRSIPALIANGAIAGGTIRLIAAYHTFHTTSEEHHRNRTSSRSDLWKKTPK